MTDGDSVRADLLVIGFGKGGKTLAATLAARGQRTVLVEQSPLMYGGTCINTGCVPTKSMVFQGRRALAAPPVRRPTRWRWPAPSD